MSDNVSDNDKRILVNALTNMLEILGVLLSGQTTIVTKVTKEQAEKLIKNAIIEYRETPNINKLSKDKVDAAIDRVHKRVHSDVASFFDEEIASASLAAASQAAMAGGVAFSFFPLVSVICEASALATMATAAGLDIDLELKSAKIVAEANGLKRLVDEEEELAPAKKWNDARADEILTLGLLNIGLQDYRADSSLYALIFVIDQKTPGLDDDQLFEAVKKLCIDFNDLAGKLPNLGDKLYEVVSNEDPTKIKEAYQAMTNVSAEVAQLVGAVVGTVVFGAILAFKLYKDYNSIRRSWNAVEGEPLPEGMESRWTKTMGTIEKVQAGIGAIIGIFGACIEIWKAVKTAEQKKDALSTVDKNRDALKTFYESVMSHVH